VAACREGGAAGNAPWGPLRASWSFPALRTDLDQRNGYRKYLEGGHHHLRIQEPKDSDSTALNQLSRAEAGVASRG
jgi:hypothetical protein